MQTMCDPRHFHVLKFSMYVAVSAKLAFVHDACCTERKITGAINIDHSQLQRKRNVICDRQEL